MRRVYNLLMGEDIENFQGWKIEPGSVCTVGLHMLNLSVLYSGGGGISSIPKGFASI